MLLSLKEMLKLACFVPDKKMACKIYEHQGICNLSIGNFAGALKSFEKMRDTAEDAKFPKFEMSAYNLIGRTFQAIGEHKNAI